MAEFHDAITLLGGVTPDSSLAIVSYTQGLSFHIGSYVTTSMQAQASLSFNPNTATLQETKDALASAVKELIAVRVLKGTVTP